MTDYLEEHLGSAEVLLERIQQLEQSASGLSQETTLKEKVNYTDDSFKKSQYIKEKSEIISVKSNRVYDLKNIVNQDNKIVDKPDTDLLIRKKEQDMDVNHCAEKAYSGQNLGQSGTTSGEEETRTSAERAKGRSPLSLQLEDLDRAVSALTAPIPEGREAAQGSYPISQGPAVYPNITNVPGEAWSGPGTATGAHFAYGGAQSWAEQADRIFRRDSRRYDGGFYLY